MNEKKDIFRSYYTQIKQSLFEISFKVLDNKGQSLQITILLSLIQFFQLLYFPFQIQIAFAWHNPHISLQIQKFLQYFTLMRLVIYQDIHIYLIGMYVAVAAVYFIGIVLFLGSILKFLSQWNIIIQILSIVLRFCMTIGFIEITRILLGFLICKQDAKGQLHMLYCPEQVCWEGTYILHASIAIITIIILFFITYIAIQLLVDLRRNETNTISQKEGNSYSFIFVYATFSLIFYSLLEHPKYSIVSILIQNSTSLIFFFKIHYNRPFYNIIVQRIWSSISGLVFYTNFMLFISYCFEPVIFKDSLICLMVSAPILLIIVLRNEKPELDLIKINIAKQLSSEEIIDTCQFLIDLILNHGKNQQNEVYMTGYLEVHKQTCQNPNCAIKVNKALSKKFKGNPKYSEKVYILKELVSQIFYDGIQRYPLSVKLKLHYSYFLFDFLEQGQKAIIELDKAENLHPSLGDEFLIFKMKKIIENFFQNTNMDSENINQILNFDRSMKYQFDQLKQYFHEFTTRKLIFWNLLLEDTPNISELFRYGNLVLQQSKFIKKELYLKLQNKHIDNETETLIKQFQKYVHNVEFNNFLKPSSISNSQFDHKFLKDCEDLSSYSYPVVVLEIFGRSDQQAIIRNMNAGFHSLLGYSKTDLIGKPASTIIQANFNQLHCSFIESYFSLQLQEKLLEIGEKLTFLVHKTKYIIPINIKSSIFATEKGVFQFVKLRQDYVYHQTGYIIFSADGKIEGVSSTCIQLLHFDSLHFQFRLFSISRLFPNLMQNKEKYLNRQSPLEYDSTNIYSINKSEELESKNSDECLKQNLVGQLFEITTKPYTNLLNDGRQQFFGYYLKIENNEFNTMKSLLVAKMNKVSNQFRYSVDQRAFVFEYVSQQTSQNESLRCDSEILEEQKIYVVTQQSFPSKKTIFKPKLQQLGSDIRVMRLFKGEITEIAQNSDDDELSQIEERSQKMEIQNEDKEKVKIKFNSENELVIFLQKISPPLVFKRSIFIITFLILSLLLISILKQVFMNSTMSDFQIGIKSLALNNQRLASLLKIQSNVQDLRGCNLNIEPYTMISTGGKFVSINFVEFNTELKILIETNIQLSQISDTIKNHLGQYSNDLEIKDVPMYTKDDKHQNFTYNEAISQLISKAIILNNSNITQFVDDNEDVHYYLHNTFNSISAFQLKSQQYYYYYVLDLLDELSEQEDLFFIIGTVNITLLILFAFIFYYYHKQNIQTIISILLGLHCQKVKQLINRILVFISILQNNEIENEESEQEEDYEKEKDFLNNVNRSRKMKKKLNFQIIDSNRLQFQFCCFIIFTQGYFCFLFITSKTIIQSTTSLIPLVNLTSYLPTQYRLLDNSVKEMLYDENAVLYNEINSIDHILEVLSILKQLDATLHQYNQQNSDILSDEYKSTFNSLYIQNPCNIIIANDPTVNVTACETFNKNILQAGLAVAITNFFENAQYILQQYSLYNKSVDYSNLKFNISTNHRNNYTYNLINTKIYNSNRKMQKVFIRICHMVLVQELENFINTHFQDLLFQTTLLFTIFCFLYSIGYFVFFIPTQIRFYLDIQQAKEILTLIPIEFYNSHENLQILLGDLREAN